MEMYEVLERSLKALQERGWVQGGGGVWNDGDPSVCAMGALCHGLWGGLKNEQSDGELAENSLALKPYHDLLVVAGHFLPEKIWYRGYVFNSVSVWNDKPGRTQGEVEDLFRKAIRDEKVRVGVTIKEEVAV